MEEEKYDEALSLLRRNKVTNRGKTAKLPKNQPDNLGDEELLPGDNDIDKDPLATEGESVQNEGVAASDGL